MKIEKRLIIPDREHIEESLELAERYGCGFEYNDFFSPAVLADAVREQEIIDGYKRCRLPEYCTLHGAFLDVTVFSDDPEIRVVSEKRVEQSLCAAEKLGAKAVIFHTNYIANFLVESYREGWVEKNAVFWKRMLAKHPSLQIYMENMFDADATLLAALAERLASEPRFGVCFDYAHAHVFGEASHIDDWVSILAPYVRHIHINDNDWICDSHLGLGEGRIDWEHFANVYEKYFPTASVLIEMNGYERMKQSLRYLEVL